MLLIDDKRYSVYLLYSTKAQIPAAVFGKSERAAVCSTFSSTNLQELVVLKYYKRRTTRCCRIERRASLSLARYSLYLLYWYKSTNTDRDRGLLQAGKALQDADKCIALMPEFVKGALLLCLMPAHTRTSAFAVAAVILNASVSCA